MAYIYILALFFFTIINAQGTTTSWTGAGQNATASNSDNWSNGVPTSTSTVNIVNCPSGNYCYMQIDQDLTVAVLNYAPDAASTFSYIEVNSGAKFTVTQNFTFGSPDSYKDIEIRLIEASTFEIDNVATVYPSTSGSYLVYGYDSTDNWFINKANVTVLGNNAQTTSYDTIQVGYYSKSYQLSVNSWGSWSVPDGRVQLEFYYLAVYNIYGGDYWGSWLQGATSALSIHFYATDVILQEGTGKDDTAGVVGSSFGWIEFESDYSQSGTDYSSTPPSVVMYNTTGITISNALFDSSNIVFLYDGWLMDCNITSDAMVNSSSTVSGVHAYFIGENNLLDGAIFAGVNTDFVIQVENGAKVTMHNEFSLYGSVTLVNNGNWVFQSNSDLYWDQAAYWVNLGLFQIITSSNDWIRGSSFPGLAQPTSVGTFVNYGTVEFSAGGGLYFYDGTGTYRQCDTGITKFRFDTTSTPGSVQFAEVIMDGYLGFSFSDDYDFSTYQNIFTWKTPSDGAFEGSVSVISNTVILGGKLLCLSLSTSSSTAILYAGKYLDNPLLCPGDETQIIGSLPVGETACSVLPDNIQAYKDAASCPASSNCGVDAGNAGSPPGAPSSANVNVASLAFLVSLVCLLLKF